MLFRSSLTELGAAADDIPILVSGTTELMKTLDQSAESYAASSEVLQQNAENVRFLVAALEELDGMSLRTSAQNQAMLEIIEQLNAAIPGMNLAYDEQTKSLSMNAAEIRELAAAEAERINRAADIQRLAELEVEQKQITLDLKAAEAQLSEAEKQRANMEGFLTKEIREANEAIRQAKSSVKLLEDAQNSHAIAIQNYLNRYSEYQDEIDAARAALENETQSTEESTDAAEDAANALDRKSVV